MGLIEYYLIFAISTALTTWYEFFWPALVEAKSLGVVNEFTEYPNLSSVIYIIISTVTAPLLVVPLLFSAKSEKFRNGLRQAIVHNK
jgi:hypothetical protein